MKSKSDSKTKQKRATKLRKTGSVCEKSVDEKAVKSSLKSQHSSFVKEKIKEILEDGQKKTFITLKSRQVADICSTGLENRISVIRSVSSLLDEQKQLFHNSMAFHFNDEHINSIHL
jgi:hypothetical protein